MLLWYACMSKALSKEKKNPLFATVFKRRKIKYLIDLIMLRKFDISCLVFLVVNFLVDQLKMKSVILVSPYQDELSSSDISDRKYSRLTPSVAGNLECSCFVLDFFCSWGEHWVVVFGWSFFLLWEDNTQSYVIKSPP